MTVNGENITQNHKFTNMILSIIFAVGIWLAIVYINDPGITTRMSGLPVKYKGEQELRNMQLTVADKTTTSSVSIKISGKRSDLMEYMDKIFVEVDLTQISSAGEYTLPASVSLPSSKLTIEKTSSDTIPVKVEALVKKSIPIKVIQTGINKDFFVKSIPIISNAEITGSAAELENVSYGAVNLDISNIVQNYTEPSMRYLMYDANGNPVSQSDTITADISETDVVNTIYRKTLLPAKAVLDESLAASYVLNTQKTLISAKEIEVGITDDFDGAYVEFLIDRYTSKSEAFGYNPQVGLFVPDSSIPKITPVLEKRTVKPMTLTINALDIPVDMNAEFNHEITVNMPCGESVQPSEVSAHISFAAYTVPGTYEIPVVFTGSCIEAPHTTVTVNLTKKQTQ